MKSKQNHNIKWLYTIVIKYLSLKRYVWPHELITPKTHHYARRTRIFSLLNWAEKSQFFINNSDMS